MQREQPKEWRVKVVKRAKNRQRKKRRRRIKRKDNRARKIVKNVTQKIKNNNNNFI
jgi:hypothetical protein